ncbi:MAG: DUF4845 domain-containing protein [Gammaproteobacteria bacterium]|nr:DUF4845 domain-containing protein [Gammaproteobacteria bacterium]
MMIYRQKGMTAISFILIAALVGLVGYGAVRLIPVYLNQMKIQKLMTNLREEFDGNNPTQTRIQSAIGRQMDVDMISYPRQQDFNVVKTNDGFRVEISYSDTVPYIANISLTADFDNSVEIRK